MGLKHQVNMAQATKILKVNGGDAFIEIGETYIRIGVGPNTSFTLDKSSMTADTDQFNMQMSPEDVTYQGILTNVPTIAGLFPIGPKYSISLNAVGALIAAARGMAAVAKATSIGV